MVAARQRHETGGREERKGKPTVHASPREAARGKPAAKPVSVRFASFPLWSVMPVFPLTDFAPLFVLTRFRPLRHGAWRLLTNWKMRYEIARRCAAG
jgi:hypothetical protein